MVLFDWPIFTEGILPFLLVFVLIFAILQKSKILGDGKAQIDALISLAISLILLTVPVARDIVVGLTPWLAVGTVVILVFFILYGFVAGDLSAGNMPKGLKIAFGVLAAVFVFGVVVYVTGFWSTIEGWFSGDSGLFANIFMLLIIGGAVAVAVATGKKGGDKG